MSLPIFSLKPGDVHSGAPRRVSLARVLASSGGLFDKPGWPDRNLHTDAAAAAAAGLAAMVVSATQWEGHMAGLLVDIRGLAWFDGGEMNVKMPRSVGVGETLVSKVRLEALAERDGRTVAAFSVWVENAEAQQVLVGTASCPMPAAHA